MARRAAPALLALALLLGGCGGGGVSAGATVSVYVGAPLCRGARGQLAREAGAVEDLRIRVVCLSPARRRGRVDLVVAGANARRATEDSTSVAYLEAPGPAAGFSQTIVEAADIAWLETGSGSAAMRRALQALGERGSTSPRDAVRESLG